MPRPSWREVEQHAAALLLDPRERVLELLAAVAAERVEDVARQALGVHAHEHVLLARDLSLHHRHVMLVVDQRAEADHVEVAELRGQPGLDDALDQLVVAAPVGDQVGDRDHLQPVLRAVALEVGHARHRAVVVHDLADHAGRVEAGEPREVHRRLGLAGALEHAAGLRLQREDVTRLDEVAAAACSGRSPPARCARGRARRCRS